MVLQRGECENCLCRNNDRADCVFGAVNLLYEGKKNPPIYPKSLITSSLSFLSAPVSLSHEFSEDSEADCGQKHDLKLVRCGL